MTLNLLMISVMLINLCAGASAREREFNMDPFNGQDRDRDGKLTHPQFVRALGVAMMFNVKIYVGNRKRS